MIALPLSVYKLENFVKADKTQPHKTLNTMIYIELLMQGKLIDFKRHGHVPDIAPILQK